MQLIAGKWLDENEEPIAYHLLGKEIKKLGGAVIAIFDEDISYEQINIVNSLSQKDKSKEKIINLVLHNKELLYKLSSY